MCFMGLMFDCDAFQVCCDLQSADGHQRRPAGHHHLGHSDWTKEERLPLRELCTLAHIQVSTRLFLILFLFPVSALFGSAIMVYLCILDGAMMGNSLLE